MPAGSHASARTGPRTLALPLFDRSRPSTQAERPVANGIPASRFPASPRRSRHAAPPACTRRPARRHPPRAAPPALGTALDDLPGQARRFARWRRAARATPQANKNSRPHPPRRPLRPGRRPASAPPSGAPTRCTRSCTTSTASPSTCWRASRHVVTRATANAKARIELGTARQGDGARLNHFVARPSAGASTASPLRACRAISPSGPGEIGSAGLSPISNAAEWLGVKTSNLPRQRGRGPARSAGPGTPGLAVTHAPASYKADLGATSPSRISASRNDATRNSVARQSAIAPILSTNQRSDECTCVKAAAAIISPPKVMSPAK